MEVVDSLITLGQYGVVGVMIALILLCGTTIYFLFKIMCNHLAHTNIIFEKNTEALATLTESQRVNTEALYRLIDKV